ncbi:hypothetical protein GCM10027347_26070 [Larkinella harenae]
MAQFIDQQTDAYPLPQAQKTVKTNLESNQKKVLGISAAAVLLGGAAWAIVQKIQERKESTDPQTSDTPDTSSGSSIATLLTLPADIDVAGKVTDSMSFEQAFRAARDEVGMGGVFSWQGRWYNTFEKEEWTSLSLEQRQEYTEMILGEKLPVKSYQSGVVQSDVAQVDTTETPAESPETEPTLIEGHLNGQHVMGLDFDQDGIIDTLVIDGEDGYVYRVVDATGSAGLDTLYQYDAQNGEFTMMVHLEEPIVLSNEDFSQSLEHAMSQEIVDSILEPDTAPADVQGDDSGESSYMSDETVYLADANQPEDDTYINNGDIRDMDQD